MAHFIVGFCFRTEIALRLRALQASLLEGDRFLTNTCQTPDSQVISWQQSKASIPEVLVRDETANSWLLLAGAPLTGGPLSEPARQELLAAFLAAPDRCIRESLDGCFAVLAYDAPRQRFLAASDFNRTVPVFYAVTEYGAYFASSELVLAKALQATLDERGFAQTIHLGTPWDARTRFLGISKLLPTEILILDKALKPIHRQYWHPEEEAEWPNDLDNVLNQWGHLLADSVSKYYSYADNQPLVCALTAGEDARLVLSQCHALGLPYRARVHGFPGSRDIKIAQEASRKVGIPLITVTLKTIDAETLLKHAMDICLRSDGYEQYFKACTRFTAARTQQQDAGDCIYLGGVPGGEAFRGSYYLRAKLITPGRHSRLDSRFFVRMKFLLDHTHALLAYPDRELFAELHELTDHALEEVQWFSDGIKVDHLIRVFQTCAWGMGLRYPLHMPLATASLTQSIYSISPRLKASGRLTKALTERLFPELAHVRTQHGVPTIRRTIGNLPQFFPEYVSLGRKAINGILTRITRIHQRGRTVQRNLSLDYTRDVFTTLLNEEPYRSWFLTPNHMLTGELYNQEQLTAILAPAQRGTCKRVNTLARIISQELAYRWVRS